VHVACCSLVDGGRYETRYCACERSMIVAVTSPRRHCSHKCGLRVWRAARAAP